MSTKINVTVQGGALIVYCSACGPVGVTNEGVPMDAARDHFAEHAPVGAK